jgi:para-aminobenzoate synthetase component 1
MGEPGDPGLLAADFLAEHGLGLPTSAQGDGAFTQRDGLVAQLYLSAAAGAAMIGGVPSAPSPAPSIPDLVVVVYSLSVTESDRFLLPGGSPGPWTLDAWEDSWTPQRHAQAVEQVRAAIAWGEVYQVNVVGHASARYAGNPIPALHRLTQLPGAVHGGVLAGDGWALASASPELLVSVHGGQVETRPIKGTRPATEAGRRELLDSAKERAEHIMIVDLERNDLAHIARTGTVTVPELFAVRRWCDLWQAESRVVGTLADGVGLADLLRAVCPGGSVTGAPKLAALRRIAALEPVGRGASMGALGWLDRDRLELGLTIRTAAVDAERVHLWAGGGITWDSDPWAEVAEAAAKAAPLRATLAG